MPPGGSTVAGAGPAARSRLRPDATCEALPGRHRTGHHGVRRQRPGPAAPAAGEPAVAGRGGRHRRVDRRPAARRCSPKPASSTAPSTWSSPAPTTASSAASSRTTSAACRSPRRGARRPAGLRDERRAAAAAARLPAAAGRPGLVRHGARQVAAPTSTSSPTRPSPASSRRVAYRLRQRRRRARRAGHPHRPARAGDPAGLPGLHVPHAGSAPGPGAAGGPRLVRPGAGRPGRGQLDDGRTWHAAELEPADRAPLGLAALALRVDGHARQHVLTRAGHRRRGRHQPLSQPWNRGGFANNAVQRIAVHSLGGESADE